MRSFIPCNKSYPCVICGRPDNGCSDNPSKVMKHCRGHREDSPPIGWRYVGEDKTSAAMFVPDYGHETHYNDPALKAQLEENKRKRQANREAKRNRSDSTSSVTFPKDDPLPTFDRVHKNKRPMTPKERDWIADHLRLPKGIFDLLGVMYLPRENYHDPAFVFPERDAARNVIGYSLRYLNGKKINCGRRGLSIPTDWDPSKGGLLVLCEGASDTLALRAMNINAIGRPSNMGGVDILAELLRPVSSKWAIVMLGENDLKPTGKWPGRDGAEDSAQKLADYLRLPIHVSMPPADIKDVRDFIHANEDAVRVKKTKTLANLGAEFASHCRDVAVTFNPVVSQAEAAAKTAAINPPSISVIGTGTQSPSPASASASSATNFPNLGFTALDYPPPPDPSPCSNECKHCPNPRGVNMRHDINHSNASFWFDCKRISCKYCEKKKREHWQTTIQHHLTTYGERSNPNVWMFRCDAASWDTVSRNLRSKHADYFRLEIMPGQLMVVSTEAPGSEAISGLTQLAASDAANRLCTVISAAHAIHEKQLTSSRDWKLLEEPRNPIWKGWRRISKIEHSQQAVLEILELRKIDFKHIKHAGRFWGWSSWQWTDAQCEAAGGYQRIFDDISVGEVLQDGGWNWGREDGSDAHAHAQNSTDEFDDEFARASAGAGPPVPSGVWLDW